MSVYRVPGVNTPVPSVYVVPSVITPDAMYKTTQLFIYMKQHTVEC